MIFSLFSLNKFKNVFSTKFQRYRCKATTSFKPFTAEALERLLKQRFNGKKKAFSLDFLRVENSEYNNVCSKVTYLKLKKEALPLSAVTERQIIDQKISSIRDFRRTIPSRV
jgi:hypothetical protein|tara:strand:- start:241 stop:576 length:336 start_codon:yes stop_codon:yes gene_type:complete